MRKFTGLFSSQILIKMIQIENGYAWRYEPFDGWIKCGKIVKGFDGYYIQWFA
jgi:hypothetical protein